MEFGPPPSNKDQLTDTGLPELPPAERVEADTSPIWGEDDSYDETYDEPSTRVEMFLADISGLIRDSHAAWQRAAAQQTATKARHTTLIEEQQTTFTAERLRAVSSKPPGTVGNIRSERTIRRGNEKMSANRGRLIIGLHRSDARSHFQVEIAPLMQQHLDALAQETVINEAIDRQSEVYYNHLKAANEEMAPSGRDLFKAYLLADYADARVLAEIDTFLQDETVVTSFMDRMSEIGALTVKGVSEFPGLMEVLATDWMLQGNKCLLHKAFSRVIAHPAEYVDEFIRGFMSDDIPLQNRKELTAAIGIMQLIGKEIMDGEFSVDYDGYLERLASHWQAWPPQMRQALEKYVDVSITKYRQSALQSLTPFLRKGRSVGTNSRMETVNPRRRKRQPQPGESPPGGSGPSGSSTKLTFRTPSKAEDMTDIMTEEAENNPISSFAILKHTTAGRKQDVLRMESLGSGIDDIMGAKEIKSYLASYQGDTALAGMVKAALEQITINPFNPTTTAQIQRARYFLETSKTQPRFLRRFSLQHFPGVEGGSITSKTRIMYAVHNMEGVPTIALYGIFLKQDIENITGLPRRR